MNHEHPVGCSHSTFLGHCAVCDVVYCRNCNKEWSYHSKPSWRWDSNYTVPIYNNLPTNASTPFPIWNSEGSLIVGQGHK